MADCIVLGAGMVGVSTALALQEKGRSVVLVDRRGAGEETSYGNAGLIQSEAVEPYAFPRDLASVMSIALRIGNEVNWNPLAMPKWAEPVMRYFMHSSPGRYKIISQTYSALIHRATSDHDSLIVASGSDNLIQKQGFRQVFRTAAKMEAGARAAERLRDAYGVGVEIESGADLKAREPNLRRELQGSVRWTDPWSCMSPGQLTANYEKLFEKRGGRFVTGDASTLTQAGSGWKVSTDEGWLEASDVVIALGPWTPELLKPLGYRIPMLFKRGYHRHFTGGQRPTMPIQDAENAAFLSPMLAGMRVLTGAELTHFAAGPGLRQLNRAERGVRELFDLGEPVENVPWWGNRPCMPDMLPVVGPAPRHKGLWLNFGHGHQGFTLGPTTAALLAEKMVGEGDTALVDRLALDRK